MKSTWKLWLASGGLTLLVATPAFSQSSGASPKTPPGAGPQKTIVGCITNNEGRYMLGTAGDKLYVLQGDPALLKRYNVVMVQVTGTLSEAAPGPSKYDALSQQPPTLTVSQMKKVADGCN